MKMMSFFTTEKLGKKIENKSEEIYASIQTRLEQNEKLYLKKKTRKEMKKTKMA